MGQNRSRPHLLVCDGIGFRLEDQLGLLRDLGYSCTYLQNAKDLVGSGSQPDAVLVSAEIPGGPSGDDFSHVLAAFPGIPVLAVAHVRSLSTAIEFFRAGVRDYLAAPLNPAETGQRLAQALETRSAAEPEEVEAEWAAAEENKQAECRAEEPAGPGARPESADPGVSISALPCGVIVCDGRGRLRWANDAALSLLGEATSESLAERMQDPVGSWCPQTPAGRAMLGPGWPPARALADKAARSAALSLRRSDRTRVWVQVDALPVMARGRVQLLTVTLVNVTGAFAGLQRSRPRASGRG